MRSASPEFVAALSGSRDVWFTADLYYGDTRRFTDLPIDAPSFSWDASGEVEGSGSATVVWTDAHGASLSPTEPADWLAPFGARLVIFANHRAVTTSRIQLGEFAITSVPSSVDGFADVQGVRITVGSKIEVRLQDRMIEVARDRFTQPTAPASLTSCFDEIRRLTGFQLTRTVPDAAITRTIVYEESRAAVVQEIAAFLGGVAYMESDGTLAIRPTTPGAPVAHLEVGEQGSIGAVGAELDSDAVYNGVVITSETETQQPIRYELWVTEGPLAATVEGGPRTPFHRVPRFFNLPFITSLAQAQAAAPALLEQVSQPRAAQLVVQCLIDPRLQLGDVVTVDDGTATWTIRLTKIDLGLSAYMTVTGSVISRDLHG